MKVKVFFIKKKIFSYFLILLYLTISCSNSKTKEDQIPVPEGYTLVWNDEFDYSGLPDDTKWGYDTGNHGWGNQELQNYVDNTLETASVADGLLTITAFQLIRGQDKEFVSARLVSRTKGD